MARKERDTESPARRRKRKSQEPPPKTPKKKKSSPAVAIIGVLIVMAISWTFLAEEEGGAPSGKIGPSIVGVLDQVYLGCTVYWFQRGSQFPCSQEIADTLYDPKKSDIKVTVTNAKKKEFYAEGKHFDSPMVMRVDSDGEIFVKAKECETNIKLVVVSDINLEELESQCNPK